MKHIAQLRHLELSMALTRHCASYALALDQMCHVLYSRHHHIAALKLVCFIVPAKQ